MLSVNEKPQTRFNFHDIRLALEFLLDLQFLYSDFFSLAVTFRIIAKRLIPFGIFVASILAKDKLTSA